jgi:hypothetical protein
VSGGKGVNASRSRVDWLLHQRFVSPLLDRGRRLGSPEVSTGITASSGKHVSEPNQNVALLGRIKYHLDDGNERRLALRVKELGAIVPPG